MRPSSSSAANDDSKMSPDQRAAERQIMDAIIQGRKARASFQQHLLTGWAGTGKTWLMARIAKKLRARGISLVVSAFTHKAVNVISKKMEEAGVFGVRCCTIDSLLSLKAKILNDRLEFVRDEYAPPVLESVVMLDECGMIDSVRMGYIDQFIPNAFVLFCGDEAQIPPIGEKRSLSFDVPNHSHLETIQRQAEGNPILQAATAIRLCQGGPMDWSWVRSNKAGSLGVFTPRDVDSWLEKAFTSPEFEDDSDTFRYMCYTNDQVRKVNTKIRRWRYGYDVDKPFMPGEKILFRNPMVVDEEIVIQNSEEVKVLDIARDVFRKPLKTRNTVEQIAAVPAWRMTVRKASGEERMIWAPSDPGAYGQIIAQLTAERRWKHLHAFKSGMADVQALYCMTIHRLQGSTVKHAFMDIPDISMRLKQNRLEAQQLFYVAATRPTTTLTLVGA